MDNYHICGTLASGSTSKVKKIVDNKNNKFAVKIIGKSLSDRKKVEKEAKIHKSVDHPNILKFIEMNEDDLNYNLVMQLAPYELMDLIVPDQGTTPAVAHFYFKQLISAVKYLHGRNICHRDIKIDNILIDSDGNLLLADFGFATLYKMDGRKRLMSSYSGSPVYMAPEVLKGRYEGDKVDMWSCGVVLAVMSSGSLLWDQPVLEDERFATYYELKYHNYAPFNRMDYEVLSLAKRLMCLSTTQRATLSEVETNPWFARSSPLMNKIGKCVDKNLIFGDKNNECLFSQPIQTTHPIKTNFISSQPIPGHNFPSLKRIYIHKPKEMVVKKMAEILLMAAVKYEEKEEGFLFNNAKSVDSINGEVIMQEITGVTCVTFNKIKGCSVEFRKMVNAFCTALKA